MDAEKLFENIQTGTGKNPTDIALVLDALITSVIEKTRAGQAVDFAEFGRFSFSEYSKIEFTANQDFAKLINYRYQNSLPIVVDYGISPVETAVESKLNVTETDLQDETLSEMSLPDSNSEPAGVLPVSDNQITEIPETATYVDEPALQEPDQEIALSGAPFQNENVPAPSFGESEPEIFSSQEPASEEPSPFIGEPEPVVLPEETTAGFIDFGTADQKPQDSIINETETGSVSESSDPILSLQPEPQPTQQPEPLPKPTPAFSWSEPEVPASAKTEEEPGKPVQSAESGNTYQYQYLSHTELNKEMDKWYIWLLIGLGVIALGAFIYWFMQGDVKKIKTVQKSQLESILKDSTVKQTPVKAITDSTRKDSTLLKQTIGPVVPGQQPAGTQPSVVSPAPTSGSSAKVPVKPEPDIKVAVKGVPASTVPAPVVPAKVVTGQPAAKTDPVQKTEPKKEIKPVEKTVSSVSSVTAEGLKGTYDESKGGFTLNVASVPSADQAQKAVNSWKSKGYASGYKESVVNGKTIFRVRVGQFSTRAAAVAGQAAFKSEVKDAWVDKIK